MNIIQLIETEISYVSQFSVIDRYDTYLIAHDDFQKDKYFHNFMMIFDECINEDELKAYENKQLAEGFVIFRFESMNQRAYPLLENYTLETYGYFHAPIDNLAFSNQVPCQIKVVDPRNDEAFFDFLYQEDIVYGEAYAKSNASRLNQVLTQNQSNFFYMKLEVDQKMIGHVNATVCGAVAKIDEFQIKKSHQRKGYGSALMSAMVQTLKERNIRDVYLVTDMDDTAKDLYVRYGFTHLHSYRQYFKPFKHI